jgi:hypothetical protein
MFVRLSKYTDMMYVCSNTSDARTVPSSEGGAIKCQLTDGTGRPFRYRIDRSTTELSSGVAQGDCRIDLIVTGWDLEVIYNDR